MSVSLCLLARGAAAADEEAPEVVGPADMPGADVIWYQGEEYTLNATGSKDDTGIVAYSWEIACPDSTTVTVDSTTPTATWTPTDAGVYKVVSWAVDAAGNKGFYVFAIDVVEVIPAQQYSGGTYTYDHSVAVTTGTLEYKDCDIVVTGGRKAEGVLLSKGEMFCEDVIYKGVGGKLAGRWESFYPYSEYAMPQKDTSTKLIGDASIKYSGGYNYGFKYVFDNTEDLTGYDSLVFWLKAGYYYCDGIQLEFFSDPSSDWPYLYTYQFIYPEYGLWVNGWYGITVALDFDRVGYVYNYGVSMDSIGAFRMYFYNWDSEAWIDGAYFAKETWNDNITESTNPTGSWGGYWYDGYASSFRFLGSSSVAFDYSYEYNLQTIGYVWDTPQDLSAYNGLRMFTYFDNWEISAYRVWFYDEWGDASYFNIAAYEGGTYFCMGSTDMGHWYLFNCGLDHSFYYGWCDWTRVKEMSIELYAYYTGTVWVDGVEFYQATGLTDAAPSLGENIPHGIYALQGGQLKMDGVHFSSPNPFGAFVRCDADLVIKDSTFDGLWGTQHASIKTTAQTYGGILCFGADQVLLDGVTITKASSSGIYVENSNVDARDLDLSGVATDYPGAAALMVSFVNTRLAEADTVKVSGCIFHDSPQGSGVMVLSQDAKGDATITLDAVTASNNGVYGAVIEVVGWTGNLEVDVLDSFFRFNKGSGFAFVEHNAKPEPRTSISFHIKDSDGLENGAYGFLFTVQKSVLRVTGTIESVESYENDGDGIGFDIGSMAGSLDLTFDGVGSHENLGNGMYIKDAQSNFKDISGTSLVADGTLNIILRDCRFNANEGDGVQERHFFSGGWDEGAKPVMFFNLRATGLVVEKNGGNGYFVGPYGMPENAGRVANYVFADCTFTDNNQDGFLIYDFYSVSGKSYGYVREWFNFTRCSFTYNLRGLEQYWQAYSYGVESWVYVKGCTFEDNDVEAIKASGEWEEWTDSGGSYLQTAAFDIQDSVLGGYVNLDISGAHDYWGEFQPSIRVTLINDTYTSDMPIRMRLTANAESYETPLEVTVVYRDVFQTSPSTGDGINIEMYGGCRLRGTVDISGQRIVNPLGDGIHITMGTWYMYQWERKDSEGRVLISDVDIIDPMGSGVVIETRHRNTVSASSKGVYALTDVKVTNAEVGVDSANFDGEVRDCQFTGIRSETIHTYYGVVDVYESKVGAIAETNLRVDEKGAIRLWFQLGVKVVWKGTDDFVNGSSVEIKDNTWNIIGVNAIDSPRGILFTNLNSYTMLPDGIFTRNPYIITVDYIGIVKEARVTVDKNMDVTVEIVDDIPPRLTVETPRDGQEQREPTILVKGTTYDKHTGLDRVEVSTDGRRWARAAIGTDGFTFTYTVTDAPEGLVVVQVRAFDATGNSKQLMLTVHIDSTPPILNVITPTDGMRTNKRTVEIVGTTDVGSRVYINDRPIMVSYTLISYSMVLSEGPNAVKVTAVDYLGNVNQIVRYVTLDTQAPYIAMVTEDVTVSTPTVTVVGMTEPVDVTIKVAGMPVTIDADGRFTAVVNLKDGVNKVDVHGVDGVGNERHVTLMLTLDRTAPWVRLISPSGDVVTDKDLQVEGFVELGAKVFVNEREVDTSYGHFLTTVSATEGPFNLHIVAMDAAGKEATMDKSITVDTVAPAIEVRTPVDGFVTNVPTIEVAGSISLGDERAVDVRYIELYISGVPRLFNFLTGEFAQDVALEEGVNHIVVRAVDPAGNEATLTRTVMLDSQAPYLSVHIGNTRMDPNWNEPVSLSDFVYVSGFTDVDAALSVNGVSVQVDRETGSFNYSLDLAAPTGGLRIATTTVRVVATDAAGNAAIREQGVNRISAAGTKQEAGTDSAQWMVLMLALVIFGLSFIGAISYQRMQAQEEMIEALEARPPAAIVTPEGTVVSPPPARPVRGGLARHRPEAPGPEEGEGGEGGGDDVVVDLEGDK